MSFTPAPGATLLHYRLVAKLGEGGMGVVWKATDTSLDRDVAIKILPEGFASDHERLIRFEREAKTLASLNHTNIAAVYGLHEHEGMHFIAMECVAGEDLSQRLQRGSLAVDDALDAARQIAEALEVAHEHGIVHRDLKPANVKRAPDGQVKVLDFGLAKAAADASEAGDPESSPTLTSEGTRTGVILGTAAYMSPEQARGRPVDRRADIWAFGCVVFEMLTAKRAFPGATISDTLVSVLQGKPDWDALPASAPAAVRRLLERCVDKDARHRLRDIGEARVTLEDVRSGAVEGDPGGVHGAAAAAPLPTPSASSRVRATIVALVLGAGLFAAGWLLRPSPPPLDGIPSDASIRRLTFATGLEHAPALSPDGNYVAYTTDAGGNLDIEVLPLAGGSVTRVVDHPADDAHPRWSPDGTRLAFVSARNRPDGLLVTLSGLGVMSNFVTGAGGDIFLVPALGGTATMLVDNATHPSWSPDGTELVFASDRGAPTTASGSDARDAPQDGDARGLDIWRIPVGGGDPRRLTQKLGQDYQPTWSPDGRWVVYCTLSPGERGLMIVPADGGESAILYDGRALDPAWSPDGRWVYFSSDRTSAEGVYNIWRLRITPSGRAEGDPVRVTFGEGSDINTSLIADASRLAFASVRFDPDIWKLDVASGEVTPVTTEDGNEDYPHLNADGRRLLFESSRGGGTNRVWLMDLMSGKQEQLVTTGSGRNPRWSRDGSQFAYHSFAEGESRLVVQRWGDVTSKTVAVSGNGAGSPTWSPDGTRLAANGIDGVWVYALDGASEHLLPNDFSFPSWSPDGKTIAVQRQVRSGIRDIWLVAATGGEPRRVTQASAEYSHPKWHPTDSDQILVVIDHKDLGILRLSTGEVERVTSLAASTVLVDYPSWSPDGREIYFSFARRTGDVFLVEDL